LTMPIGAHITADLCSDLEHRTSRQNAASGRELAAPNGQCAPGCTAPYRPTPRSSTPSIAPGVSLGRSTGGGPSEDVDAPDARRLGGAHAHNRVRRTCCGGGRRQQGHCRSVQGEWSDRGGVPQSGAVCNQRPQTAPAWARSPWNSTRASTTTAIPRRRRCSAGGSSPGPASRLFLLCMSSATEEDSTAHTRP
jgi:hypothetical protein